MNDIFTEIAKYENVSVPDAPILIGKGRELNIPAGTLFVDIDTNEIPGLISRVKVYYRNGARSLGSQEFPSELREPIYEQLERIGVLRQISGTNYIPDTRKEYYLAPSRQEHILLPEGELLVIPPETTGVRVTGHNGTVRLDYLNGGDREIASTARFPAGLEQNIRKILSSLQSRHEKTLTARVDGQHRNADT